MAPIRVSCAWFNVSARAPSDHPAAPTWRPSIYDANGAAGDSMKSISARAASL